MYHKPDLQIRIEILFTCQQLPINMETVGIGTLCFSMASASRLFSQQCQSVADCTTPGTIPTRRRPT